MTSRSLRIHGITTVCLVVMAGCRLPTESVRYSSARHHGSNQTAEWLEHRVDQLAVGAEVPLPQTGTVVIPGPERPGSLGDNQTVIDPKNLSLPTAESYSHLVSENRALQAEKAPDADNQASAIQVAQALAQLVREDNPEIEGWRSSPSTVQLALPQRSPFKTRRATQLEQLADEPNRNRSPDGKNTELATVARDLADLAERLESIERRADRRRTDGTAGFQAVR